MAYCLVIQTIDIVSAFLIEKKLFFVFTEKMVKKNEYIKSLLKIEELLDG